jgi:hypothetical protein
MLPSNYQDLVDEDEDRRGPFLITQNTKVTFLARRYRLVFVLDLSPSMTTVVSDSDLRLHLFVQSVHFAGDGCCCAECRVPVSCRSSL